MASITQEARSLRKLRERRDTAKKKYEELDTEFKARQSAFMERLEQDGVDSIRVDGVLFVPAETTYGTIQDRSAFIEWAKENAPEMFEEKERSGLVNELVRERLDNGEPLPPGVGFYVREYVSQRAA